MNDKEELRAQEEKELKELLESWQGFMLKQFTLRELRLILNCWNYAEIDPAGLPGHNVIVLVAKLSNLAGLGPDDIRELIKLHGE